MAQRPNKWLVALSVTFGTLMGAIDGSIVNVALPHIRGSVGATVDEITAISTSYMIANVLVMPLTGFLGRLFGQKRVYMACLVIFLVGSMFCGFAHTLPELVLFRSLQGLGAGALQPTEQAILRQNFPKEEQGTAMALFAMAVMLGPAFGPSLGGYITDNFEWPWIFYINLPIGLVGLAMVARFVVEPEDLLAANRAAAPEIRANIDWWGIGLLWTGLGALQFVLEEGSRRDWFASELVLAALAVAVIALVGLVYRELNTPYPAVNLRVFRERTFASATAVGAVMFGMLMGSMFLLPVFMQELLGFTATQSGLTLMPRTLTMMLVTPFVGRLYNRIHPAITIAVGVCAFAVGSWQLSHLTLDSGEADIIGSLVTTGVGFSCLFVPLSTVALGNVPRGELADATGLNSLMRQLGGSVGLTLFATMQARYYHDASAGLAAHVSALEPAAGLRYDMLRGAFQARGYGLDEAASVALRSLAGIVARQATVLSFEKTFLLQGLSFLAVLPLLFFLRVDQGKPAVKVEVHAE